MTTIKLKNGSGAPAASDLVQGEPALDLTNKRLYTEDSGGTVIEVGTNPTSLTTGAFTSNGIDDNADATAITIDSSENVGIGTTSPTKLLELSDTTTGDAQYLNIHNVGGGAVNDKTSIQFQHGTTRRSSRISSTLESSLATALTFSTESSGTVSEHMRIDSSGRLLLGRTTSTLGGGNGDELQIGSGSSSAGMTIHSTTTGTGDIQFADGTTGTMSYRGMVRYDHTGQQLPAMGA